MTLFLLILILRHLPTILGNNKDPEKREGKFFLGITKMSHLKVWTLIRLKINHITLRRIILKNNHILIYCA